MDQDKTTITSSASPETPPALWNPNAAACWSLLFSPAFGAYLHARNAENLGRTDEARANRIWFYGSIAFLVIVLASTFFPAVPEAIFRYTGLVILLGWYASLGQKQVKYVKETLPGGYQRKPWTKPLLIAFGCLVASCIAVFIVAEAISFLLDKP